MTLEEELSEKLRKSEARIYWLEKIIKDKFGWEVSTTSSGDIAFSRKETPVVWIAETGCYENRGVSGIYDSPERAIAAHHQEGMTWKRELWHYGDKARGGGFQIWENDSDWDEACSISQMEVTDVGNLRSADLIESFYDSSSGNKTLHRILTAEEADEIAYGKIKETK